MADVNRYRDYNSYLRGIFGERVQKISLDAGLTCPNRDGSLSDRGCVYCDARGSGTGAMGQKGLSIAQQMEQGLRFAERRYRAKKFIAYFQSFSNTYAPIPRLRALYSEALSFPGVVGLSVATRPDCIGSEVLHLLNAYQQDHLVWIEYGLQSAHDSTLMRLNRGHDVRCFEQAVRRTADHGINICAHVILGLPGEDRDMMMATARYLSNLPVQGVKIHLLYVVKGTRLAELYEKGAFACLTREEYADLVVDFLEVLPPGMVIQRLTGDPLGPELLAPHWALDKSRNLSVIKSRLEERHTRQGRLFGGVAPKNSR